MLLFGLLTYPPRPRSWRSATLPGSGGHDGDLEAQAPPGSGGHSGDLKAPSLPGSGGHGGAAKDPALPGSGGPSSGSAMNLSAATPAGPDCDRERPVAGGGFWTKAMLDYFLIGQDHS